MPIHMKSVRRKASLALLWAKSAYEGRRQREVFNGVERYCMFVGYPRSGHSLVGSLLDAHPDVVLAHELDALAYVGAGFRRDQIYWLILKRDQEFTQTGRIHITRGVNRRVFDYTVPGQWQGRYQTLRVIGDKKGATSVRRLRHDPTLLDRLVHLAGIRFHLIHVVRNPFDNIATMSLRGQRTLMDCADEYFMLCDTVEKIKQSEQVAIIDVRLEDMIADPHKLLISLCQFLQVDPDPAYLDDCSKVVSRSPHESRFEVDWTPELISVVQQRIENFSFLQGYAYDHGSESSDARPTR